MWKKFDMDFKIDCDSECGFAPLPEFNIPPPPLPPFLKEITKCSEASAAEYEMCSLIPLIDFDYNNSSMQASAMILLCSVLVLIFIFVSSIFIWKHKRKSKDSLPYKASSSTGSPMDPSIVFNGYENPDAFIIRYKTLERQQQHFNMLQPKTVHYHSSGFPMPQTPPVFICSSPGPDPYESNDNLYEELDQPDSHSELSQNDRSLPQVDRVSDNLNSSADTASATDEIAMTNNNGGHHEHEASSNVMASGAVVSCNRNAMASESGVEWRNRINVTNNSTTAASTVGAFNVATIFRDRNIQQHSTRANANYYAPPHNMMVGINSSTSGAGNHHRVNNAHFISNPRAMHCWGSQQQFCSPQYEPISPLNNSSYLGNYNQHHQHHHTDFATMRNFNSLRSPHHISQNTISSRKNLWSWFRATKRPSQ